MSAAALKEMIANVDRIEFVAQHEIELSTAPFWSGEGLVRAEPLTLRVYVAATKDGYRVMPGGLALLTRDDDVRRATRGVGLQQRRLGDCRMSRSIRSACSAARCRRRRCVVPTGICRAARPTTCIGWDVTSSAPKAPCDCTEACSVTCPARAAPATIPATLDTLARLLVSQERLTARRARRATVDGSESGRTGTVAGPVRSGVS